MDPLNGNAPTDVDGAPRPRDAKKRKFAHTNEAQRRAMVEWLELPGNFLLLTAPSGAAGLRQPSGKKIKKTDGFRALMHHVNAVAGASWTMDVTKSRFESFLTSYRKVRALAQQPGFEVTENDRSRGITDRNQKLNAMCMLYDRIDALYDPKPPLQADEVGDVELRDPTQEFPDTVGESVSESASAAIDMMEGIAASSNASETSNGANTPTRSQPAEETAAPVDRTGDPPLSPSPSVALSEDYALKQLAIERERLELLQEQLAIQKRELDLRERELQQQEEERRFALRTELASKLIQAGKSVDDVKEILALIA